MTFQKGHHFNKRKEVTTEQFQQGQMPDIPLDGINLVGGQALEPVQEKSLNTEYMDALAFMEEPVEVMVAETTDQNAENPVQVGVNGVFVIFHRGVPQVVKRKFVEGLIVKGGGVTTPEFINAAGERARAIRQTNALKYPFSIIEDRNPKGVEWLRRRLAEPI